ncbi:MAG: DUF6116 family protein [Lysobacteraceae bacterium]
MFRLLPTFLVKRLQTLRFPHLFLLTAALWLLSVLVPDPLPFVDELVLTLGTLTLAAWRRRRGPDDRASLPHVD